MDEKNATKERWLAGSPFLCRHRNVIDLDESIPVTMTPRNGQENHEPGPNSPFFKSK